VDFKFELDDIEVDEPINWSDFELSMKRDDTYHGIQFEASTGDLQFFGAGAEYLRNKRQTEGLRANVIFKASLACDTEYEEVYRGRLNFGKYKASCGQTCIVSIPAEEESCRVIFKSRFDQKVDMDSTLAFDKITALPGYAGMGLEIEIPAKALQTGVAGHVDEGSDPVNHHIQTFADVIVIMRPTYGIAENNTIATGQLEPIGNAESNRDDFPIPLSPQLLFEDTIECFAGEFAYEFGFTGTFELENNVLAADADLVSVKLKVVTWDGVGDIYTNATLVDEITLPFSGPVYPSISGSYFDQLISGTISLPDGIGFYGFIEFNITVGCPGAIDLFANNTFAPQTYVNISATKLCPPTPADAYLIHEALSHVAEAITNRCIRVRSDYYGRIDSQPFAATEDGCGGLRMFTSGLKLRQAPAGQDKYFMSMKEALEGLRGVDNIGFTIDPDDTLPGFFVLRIEPVEYFYQDTEVLVLDAIANGDDETNESGYYSRVLAGYKRWEVEKVNGLGELNSNREYRTSLDTINNTLDVTSSIVTGSYAIEVTRQQSFAESGAADTSYDNELFMLTLTRNAYDLSVEQGGISGAVNIFDPATLFNFRLTPIRNLLRWFKSIANSYPNLGSSLSRLFFSSGTGNLTAAGELTDATCKLESGVLTENQDISVSSFADQADATPLWKPENISFTYPLSVAQYQELKANPFGYLSVQCGKGGFIKAFIKEIRFSVAKGTATFTLIKKW